MNKFFFLIFLGLLLLVPGICGYTVNVWFYDETNFDLISEVTITDSNGSIYTSDVNGFWSADLSGAKSFTIFKTGYDDRPFEFYFTEDMNFNFLLNPDGDSEIEFLVKDENNELWTNKYLTIAKSPGIISAKESYSSQITDNNTGLVSHNNTSFTTIKTFTYTTNYYFLDKIKFNIGNGYGSGTMTMYGRYKVTYYDDSIAYSDTESIVGPKSGGFTTFYVNSPNSDKAIKKIELQTYTSNASYSVNSVICDIYTIGILRFLDTENYSIINSLKTSTTGTATASLIADGDYNALLYDETGILQYFYEKTTTTIYKPKDEKSLDYISPYDIYISGLLGYNLTNQSASSVSTNIFAGTVGFYTFQVVDYNESITDQEYYPRTYAVQVPMGSEYEETVSIQPYLLSKVDAVLPKILVLDELNNPIEDVDVLIYKYINNQLTVVESGKTFATGTLSFNAYPLDVYYINLSYNGIDRGTYRIQARESTDIFYFSIDTASDYEQPNPWLVQADFSDTAKQVNISDSNISLLVNIKQNRLLSTSYTAKIYQGSSLKETKSGSISSVDQDLNILFNSDLLDEYIQSARFEVTLIADDENKTVYHQIQLSKTTGNLFTAIPSMLEDLGQPLAIIIALLITVLILSGLALSGMNIGTTPLTVFGLVILGIFMFLGFLDVGITVLGFDIGRFFYVLMAIAGIYFMVGFTRYD